MAPNLNPSTPSPTPAPASPASGLDPREILDVQGLLARVDHDWFIAREVIQSFLLDAPRLLSALQHHAHTADLAALKRSAHTLKGAAACAGANSLRDHALWLEAAVADADINRVSGILGSLEPQFAAFRERAANACADPLQPSRGVPSHEDPDRRGQSHPTPSP